MPVQNLKSLITGPGDLDLIPTRAQEFAQRETDSLLVIDDQDARHFFVSE